MAGPDHDSLRRRDQACSSAPAQRLPGGVLGTSRLRRRRGLRGQARQGLEDLRRGAGREYIDYVMASGPLVLGHAPPRGGRRRVREQLEGERVSAVLGRAAKPLRTPSRGRLHTVET